MATLSILMPVYNVQDYVAEAIESMLHQTYTDFELILLDDCSTDKTAEVIKTIVDSRIVYHCNKRNMGLANNLNVGLKMAKGKYIARMDGDDISLPDRLQIQVDFLEAHPDIDLCSCGMKMFGADNQVWVRDYDPEQVKVTMLFYSAVLHASSVFRKASFEKFDLHYNQDTFPAEDYDLWSRAIFYCKMVNLPDVLYLYRMHHAQVTSTDKRSAEKCREIQLKYLQRALPELTQSDAINFVDRFIPDEIKTHCDVRTFKKAYTQIVESNKTTAFFNQHKLLSTLKKRYQYKVFIFLKTFRIKSLKDIFTFLSVLFDLRLNQIVKLILKK